MNKEKALIVYISCHIARNSGMSDETWRKAQAKAAEVLTKAGSPVPSPKYGESHNEFIDRLLEGEDLTLESGEVVE